nr:glycosyltransferase family A protein [Aureimonas altamirensis]
MAQLLPVVAVPARNEKQRLPSLLAALNIQSWCGDAEQPLVVIVVLNNCTDMSKEAALCASRFLPNIAIQLMEVDLPFEEAHVGSARKLAMDRALALCPETGGVLLTTDADAVPEPVWIEANLNAVANGADLVGGKLVGNRKEEGQLGTGFAARSEAALQYATLCDRLASLIDPLEHDPWPRHHDHTGGSLAITSEMYRLVGGLPPMPTREDLALVSKVRAAGGRVVHPLNVRVEVSARLQGRAPGGMADCLKDWLRAEAKGLPLMVEDPERVAARLLRRRVIRDLSALGAQDRKAAAQRLAIDDLFTRDNGELDVSALVERFAPDEPDAPATVPVATATARLLEIIADTEGASRAA